MAFSVDDVYRIAHLARIELDAASAEEMRAKLDSIFDLINVLQAVDTEGIEPMSHAQEVTAPLREDAVTETDRREAFQSVAPAVERGLYLVPRVVE
jgi:aspartyl-tRNA(Asn)/glutamyl-tRNA(Gln) amidotransferase subunit C